MNEKLRHIRREKNKSADYMCTLLGLKTKAAYLRKESGARRVSLEEAKIIADDFGLTIEEVFFAH